MLRHAAVLLATLALASACANIIGISDYDVDPTLDPPSGGQGAADAGGTDSGNEGGRPGGGRAGEAQGGTSGSALGGEPAVGGDTAVGGDAAVGGVTSGGETGAGGAGVIVGPDCDTVDDCDDGIACTVDTCGANGCVNQPDSSLCPAGVGECWACQAGVGCVQRVLTTTELLRDGGFDELSTFWQEYSEYYTSNIIEWEFADSLPYLVEFGPTPVGEVTDEYAWINQLVTIPAGTQSLTFSGVYQLAHGATPLNTSDSVMANLYDPNFDPVKLLHVWNGFDPERSFWQSFSYDITRAELTSVLGQEASLDLECTTWDTIFDFDSLSLEATVCPQN